VCKKYNLSLMHLLILLCELFINVRMRITVRHLKYFKLKATSTFVMITVTRVIMFYRQFRKFGVSKKY